MPHSIPFKFKQTSGTSKDGGPKLYKAIASTDALDRDREVLLPKGCVTEEFMKNPVMLRIHNYGHVPVGKVHSIDIQEKEISFKFEFSDTAEGKEIEDLYVKGFMNAFSVGLYPIKAQWIDEDGPKSMELELPDGTTQVFNLADYKEAPRRVINQWELLEISPVPVPSNPEALLIRAKEHIVRKFMDSGHSAAEGKLFESQVDDRMKSLTTDLDAFLKSLEVENEELILPKAVPSHITAIDKDAEWDNAGAKAKLSKWASSDDTGLKATVDWGMYAKGFTWVNTEKAGNFTSYKFAHHTIADDDLVGVWKGITAAMADLLGDAGKDLDEDDRAEVYAHLASHYKDAEATAPELGSEYSDEELLAIAADTYKAPSDDTTDVDDTDDPDDKDIGDEAMSAEVKQISSLIKAEFKTISSSFTGDLGELEETVRIRLSMVLNSIEEVQELLSRASTESTSTDNADDGDHIDDDGDDKGLLAQKFTDLADLLGTTFSAPDTNQ